MNINNLEVASLLRKIAAAYTVKGENFFKIQAYDKAADAVEHATQEIKDLWEEEKLDSVPGLGERIRSYLDELFKKGKVEHFEAIMSTLPKGMFAILNVPGIGPKTAYKITSKIAINSVKDLKKRAQKGELSKIPGISKKTEEEILLGIDEFSRRTGRMLLPQAWNLASEIISSLKKSKDVLEAYPLGSLRRMVVTIGDVDIAVSSKNPKRVIDYFVKIPSVQRVIAEGEHKATIVLKNGRRIDLMVQSPDRFGSLLQHFTGSKMHNIHLRKIANEKGLSLSEYGIAKLHPEGDQFSTDFLIKCEDEKDFYEKLRMQYVPPELREDSGEIELAQKAKIPELVKLEEIKGDIHIHSDFPIETSHDLGANSMVDLIKKAKELRYEYIGFSDHNPSVSQHTPKQIIDLVKRRTDQIEKINYSKNNFRVLNLLEIDILADGNLSLPEKALEMLNGSIASVHSSFRQSKKEMTRRLINVIKNPLVTVIGHPTGRLIDSREGYEVDWDEVFEETVKHNKILEINSWPERLDLPDTLVREAIEKGVKFVINTDSHAVIHMDNMRFGVAVARRGWAKKSDIINTLPWLEFKKFFSVKS